MRNMKEVEQAKKIDLTPSCARMGTGLLERILVRRYGQPIMSSRRGLNARCWNPDDFDYASVLYIGMKWGSRLGTRFGSLKKIYGDAFGGFLIKNLLKVTMLLPRKIDGVWSMGDFQLLPPVRKALAIVLPSIFYGRTTVDITIIRKAGGTCLTP